MYWVTTVAFVIFSFGRCVDSAVSSVITDVCKAAGPKKVTVAQLLDSMGPLVTLYSRQSSMKDLATKL
jgi:hypothetical protein